MVRMARKRALNQQGRSIATLLNLLGLFSAAKLWFLAIKYKFVTNNGGGGYQRTLMCINGH